MVAPNRKLLKCIRFTRYSTERPQLVEAVAAAALEFKFVYAPVIAEG